MVADRVIYYEHIPYVLPLAVNHSQRILTQFSTSGDIEHQLVLSKDALRLLTAFLDSPGLYLSRADAIKAVGGASDLETVKHQLSVFNPLLESFNLEFSAVMGQGYLLHEKARH